MAINIDRSRYKILKLKITRYPVEFLSRLGVKPNHLTILNAISSIFVIYFLFENNTLVILFMILRLIFDNLDGDLARATGQVTKFGSIFDKAVDHTSVLLMLLKAYFWLNEPIALWAFGLSLLHIIFAGDSWEAFFCPACTPILVTFALGYYNAGMWIQAIYSASAPIIYRVMKALGVFKSS